MPRASHLTTSQKTSMGVKFLVCTWRLLTNCVVFKKHADWSMWERRECDPITALLDTLMFQASSSESLMLRTARRYDSSLDAVVFSNNVPYSQEVRNASWTMMPFCHS